MIWFYITAFLLLSFFLYLVWRHRKSDEAYALLDKAVMTNDYKTIYSVLKQYKKYIPKYTHEAYETHAMSLENNKRK